MKWVMLVGWFLLATAATGHALSRIPNSYRAVTEWQEAKIIMNAADEGVYSDESLRKAQSSLLSAIIDDPWSLQYRREAWKPIERMLMFGFVVDHISSELLYKMSRRAGGNAVDLLQTRYIYLMMTSGNKKEIDGIAALLKARFPDKLKELEENLF